MINPSGSVFKYILNCWQLYLVFTVWNVTFVSVFYFVRKAYNKLKNKETLICLRNEDVVAGNFTLNVSEIVVEKGDRVEVKGEPGSGKSVLIEFLVGLRTTKKGEVCGGLEKVAYVSQTVDIIEKLTVRDNFELYLQLAGRMDKVNEIISATEFSDKQNELADNLSKLNKHRLSAFLPLLLDFDILVLDDSTAYLDDKSKTFYRNYLLNILKNEEKTVIASGEMNLPFNKTIRVAEGLATVETTDRKRSTVSFRKGDLEENESEGSITGALHNAGFERKASKVHCEVEMNQKLLDMPSEIGNLDHFEDQQAWNN